ncbi:hypothetical protein [Lederbergia citri]|uniref:Uncharacterized protein n=1 Tax=Lederbergia citri TaxID=2833580 RepID=A0A942TKN3_9BACI|nr:hypothetical protein [Lederbergia citri]MBS4197782.1 hypothetical protein [Lederbergia citri]
MLKSLALTLLLLLVPLTLLGAIQAGVEGMLDYFSKKENFIVDINGKANHKF